MKQKENSMKYALISLLVLLAGCDSQKEYDNEYMRMKNRVDKFANDLGITNKSCVINFDYAFCSVILTNSNGQEPAQFDCYMSGCGWVKN
jgi:hypothetical protein